MSSVNETKNNNFIMFSKDWFGNKNNSNPYINTYGHEALSIMCCLMKNLTLRNKIIFNLTYLQECLNLKYKNYTALNRIKSILLFFEKDKIFKYNLDINNVMPKDMIIADVINLKINQVDTSDEDESNQNINNKKKLKNTNFVMIYDFELDTILQYDGNINNNMLLAVFAYIKSCIKHSTQVCYPTIETITKNTCIGREKTVLKYINILKDIGLILYDNPGTRKFKKDGTIKECANTYTMNYDGHDILLQEKIKEYIASFDSDEVEIEKRENANKRRSETMKKYWKEIKKAEQKI